MSPFDRVMHQLDTLYMHAAEAGRADEDLARVQEVRSWVVQAARVLRRLCDHPTVPPCDMPESVYREAAILAGPHPPTPPPAPDCCEGRPL